VEANPVKSRTAAQTLTCLAEAVEEGVIIFGPKGLELANGPALKLWGQSQEELAGLEPGALLEPAPAPPGPGQKGPFSGRVKRLAGPGPFLIGQVYGLDTGGQVWVFNRNGSLSALGALAAGLAHNLAGPLSVIRSTAETMDLLIKKTSSEEPNLARRMKDWPPAVREGCLRIMEQVDSLSRETRDLLAKLRGETAFLEESLDLNEILRRELGFLKNDPAFKHGFEREVDLDPGLPSIQGLYSDFSQSFRNLLRNALEAMENSPRKVLGVSTATAPGEVLIRIADTGCGISPELKADIFEPFVSATAPADQASGLGLHSVRQLLAPYRARFEVKSQPGRTAFTIHLPLDQGEAGA